MPARIWTESVLKNVFALLLDGYDYGEIATLYGVTRTAVRSRVNQSWVGPAFRERKGIAKAKCKMFWTEERKAEFRKLYWSGKSLPQIAKAMGITTSAAKRILSKLGIADRKEVGRRVNARRIGTKHSPEAIEKMRQKARARFERADYVARHLATHTPEVMRERQRELTDRRRGFSVPDDKAEAYRHLTKVKNFRAREAAVLLGIIPNQHSLAQGA